MNRKIFKNKKDRMVFFIVVFAGAQFFLWFSFARYVSGINAIPYNIREIASPDMPFAAACLFTLICYLSFGFPVLFAVWLMKIKKFYNYLLWLLFCYFISILAFLLLKITVPLESIFDILGSPVYDWPMTWELLYRFSGLFLWPFISFTLGSGLVQFLFSEFKSRPFPLIGFFGGCLVTFCLFFYSYDIVVVHACTDNIVELMAGGGNPASYMVLSFWFVLLGLIAGMTGWYLTEKFKLNMFLIIMIFISLPIGFGLLKLGTASELNKYGKIFSALQFLLSPDRTHYLAGPELGLRYGIAHVVLLILIVINQLPFWAVYHFFKKDQNNQIPELK